MTLLGFHTIVDHEWCCSQTNTPELFLTTLPYFILVPTHHQNTMTRCYAPASSSECNTVDQLLHRTNYVHHLICYFFQESGCSLWFIVRTDITHLIAWIRSAQLIDMGKTIMSVTSTLNQATNWILYSVSCAMLWCSYLNYSSLHLIVMEIWRPYSAYYNYTLLHNTVSYSQEQYVQNEPHPLCVNKFCVTVVLRVLSWPMCGWLLHQYIIWHLKWTKSLHNHVM